MIDLRFKHFQSRLIDTLNRVLLERRNISKRIANTLSSNHSEFILLRNQRDAKELAREQKHE